MVERLEEAWPGLRGKYDPAPRWLEQVALQLAAWVGNELENPSYYEAGFDGEVSSFRRVFLRAITPSFFVDVEVELAPETTDASAISIFVAPRNRLHTLLLAEAKVRGPKPDAVRMTLTYEGDTRTFAIPRSELRDPTGWREDKGIALFLELKEDLWKTPVGGGRPNLSEVLDPDVSEI